MRALTSWLGAGAVCLLLAPIAPPGHASPGPVAPPCRCAERPLADYYAEAEQVVVARVVGAHPAGDDLRLDVALLEAPWKLPPGVAQPPRAGDTMSFVTARSSAACGLDPGIDAVVALFAPAVHPPDPLPRVHSCNGSRVIRDSSGATERGFLDVPPRFVAAQLAALSGLEVLARMVAHAPDPANLANTTLVGLLDVPAFAHGGWVQVREAPRMDAEVLARPESYVELESREVGYEVGAAVVLARVDGWYRVRLGDGRPGWIAPDEAGTWFPYADLPVDRLTYLTEGWSGHVWPEPGAGIPVRSHLKGTLERGEYPAEVLESVELAGTTWFRIQLLSASPCMDPDARPTLHGWIPAYGPTGEPTAWYYSRGC
jgi:hypothetical protein